MAKSQIIKDLANGMIDTTTALKRAKVLLSELKNNKLIDWVNCELSGYSTNDELPPYRVIHGNLVGSYFKGSMVRHMKFVNVPLPLGNMPYNMQDEMLCVRLFEGIDALKRLSEASRTPGYNFGKSIPADFYPYIAMYNGDL